MNLGFLSHVDTQENKFPVCLLSATLSGDELTCKTLIAGVEYEESGLMFGVIDNMNGELYDIEVVYPKLERGIHKNVQMEMIKCQQRF